MKETALEKAIAQLERDRATNNELRKSMILAPSPRRWFEKETVEYAFGHPHIRSRLESLMGSNIVRITDRRYMQRLQERIYEDHLDKQKKRMRLREMQEVEREKRLILSGRLPMHEASKALHSHPVMKVSKMSELEINERRSKMGPKIPTAPSVFVMLFDDASLDDAERSAVCGLTPSTFMTRVSNMDRPEEEIDAEAERLRQELLDAEDDVTKGYMFAQEEYDRLKYEDPLVKQLRGMETVDDMYRLADEIIGMLRTMKSVHAKMLEDQALNPVVSEYKPNSDVEGDNATAAAAPAPE